MRGTARIGMSLALLALGGSDAASAGEVSGRVTLAIRGARLAEVAPIVVFLEPVEAPAEAAGAKSRARIRQRNASFTPGFLTVEAGSSVAMPNDDAIFHNVFSYSKGNAFDLGLYPSGESRSVEFKTPGVVKLYCSIHESMNATVFVAPSRHHAAVDARGRFAMRNVPAGDYRLRTWCERLPETNRQITVTDGRNGPIEIRIGESTPPAAPAPSQP